MNASIAFEFAEADWLNVDWFEFTGRFFGTETAIVLAEDGVCATVTTVASECDIVLDQIFSWLQRFSRLDLTS